MDTDRITHVCTLKRAMTRTDEMRDDPSCPRRDLRMMTEFVEDLETQLDMHTVSFAPGFWRTFFALLHSDAFARVAVEGGTDEGAKDTDTGGEGGTDRYTVNKAALELFNGFTKTCEALDKTPVPKNTIFKAIGRWVRRCPPDVHVADVLVREKVVAHLKWIVRHGRVVVQSLDVHS